MMFSAGTVISPTDFIAFVAIVVNEEKINEGKDDENLKKNVKKK